MILDVEMAMVLCHFVPRCTSLSQSCQQKRVDVKEVKLDSSHLKIFTVKTEGNPTIYKKT